MKIKFSRPKKAAGTKSKSATLGELEILQESIII